MQEKEKKTIKLDDRENLSAAEVMEMRKLKFQMMESNVSVEEAEKTRKSRIEKFGGKLP